MQQFDLVLKGGRVVTTSGTATADVGIADGKVAAIAARLPDGAEHVDARGLVLLPGLIDPHVHPIHAEDYGSVSEAAAFGGVTTVLHHLYVDPDEGAVAALRRAVADAAAVSFVDFGFHVRLCRITDMIRQIPDVVTDGVSSFKIFMAYRDERVMVDGEDLVGALGAVGAAGGIALLHAEDGHVIAGLQREAERRGWTRAEDYPRTRPPWVEAQAVARVIEIAATLGTQVYFVHTTTTEALAIQTRAKLDGIQVHVETCPQYLLLTADEAMSRHGARAKIAPPLRSRRDQEMLWHAVARGLVDTIGSDHSAFAPEEKEGFEETIALAGFGAPGIEQMLSLLYDRGVRAGRVSLPRLVDVMAAAPARVFRLENKGEIRVGADADLVLFDPEAPFVIQAAHGHGNAYYSLYEGWTGKGSVRSVLLRGGFVIREGELVSKPGQGRYAQQRRKPMGARADSHHRPNYARSTSTGW